MDPVEERDTQGATTDQDPEPRIAEVNVEDLVDDIFMRKLDESGFIDRLYGTSGNQ